MVQDSSEQRERSFLIYSSARSVVNISRWLDTHCFDCAVVYYGSEDKEFEQFTSLGLRILERRQGTKIDNFLYLLEQHPTILEYDYILFADEDITISSDSLLRFMQTTSTIQASWSQPAHSWQSYITLWTFLYQKPFLEYELRDFIEIQFFALATNVIKESIGEWSNFSTGFGLDLFLAHYLQRTRGKVALVHSAVMTHPYRRDENRIAGKTPDFKARAKVINTFLTEHFALTKSPFALVSNAPHASYIRGGLRVPPIADRLCYFKTNRSNQPTSTNLSI